VVVLNVFEVHEVDDELEAVVPGLVRRLSQSAPAPTREQLVALVSHPAITFLAARVDEGPIIGILTLALFPVPTGLRAWIEDVVVDAAASRQGVGTALTRTAIEMARAAGARTVDLTSRPSREAANRLYQGLGFERRETNVYRYDLD
jgi:ribosomal protein S18 acetylase RimI-like enzyme